MDLFLVETLSYTISSMVLPARKYFEDTKMEIMKNELERNNINN